MPTEATNILEDAYRTLHARFLEGRVTLERPEILVLSDMTRAAGDRVSGVFDEPTLRSDTAPGQAVLRLRGYGLIERGSLSLTPLGAAYVRGAEFARLLEAEQAHVIGSRAGFHAGKPGMLEPAELLLLSAAASRVASVRPSKALEGLWHHDLLERGTVSLTDLGHRYVNTAGFANDLLVAMAATPAKRKRAR